MLHQKQTKKDKRGYAKDEVFQEIMSVSAKGENMILTTEDTKIDHEGEYLLPKFTSNVKPSHLVGFNRPRSQYQSHLNKKS